MTDRGRGWDGAGTGSVLQSLDEQANVCDLLCFDVGTERFALPLANVEEIVDGVGVESTRHSGGALGVLRVRDDVLPVYDASHILQCERLLAEPMAIILHGARGFVAVLVDSAEAAPRTDLSNVRTPPALLASDRVLDGVLRVGARWVGLINAVAFVEAMTADATSEFQAGSNGR